MSQFISIRRVEATNPNTGAIVQKLQVVHKDGHAYTLLTDLTVDEIKADKAALLEKVVLRDGEFGAYAMFSRVKILEEL